MAGLKYAKFLDAGFLFNRLMILIAFTKKLINTLEL